MKAHPGVNVISRDRSKEYARGASQGAPEATPVADRWHLLKNLREALELFLEQHRACLHAAANPEIEPVEQMVAGSGVEEAQKTAVPVKIADLTDQTGADLCPSKAG